jgi:NTP pyrophosphatase (non-canonical NTP hydrolase)
MSLEFDKIREKIINFREKREWKQFHDPKNLAEAISIEASELLEIFLWKRSDESRNMSDTEIAKIKNEIADIFIYSVYLCDEFGINLFSTVNNKLMLNDAKYPIDKSKGSSKKYTDL